MVDANDCIGDAIDCALQVRDDLGLQLHNVEILKRTKSAVDPELEGFGVEGTIVDSIERKFFPTPQIVDYGHSYAAREGGNFKKGDLLLKQITKNKYKESDIDCSRLDGEGDNIERFYYINKKLYTVIHVAEKNFWWNVQVRKCDSTEVYFGN